MNERSATFRSSSTIITTELRGFGPTRVEI
jgi:hypothetical protein